MYNSRMPSADELPSSKQLLRSTFLALLAAVVILVTIILPAEYAIDPTGAGRLLGLTKMGEIKQQLAAEAEAEQVAPAPAQVASSPAEEEPLTETSARVAEAEAQSSGETSAQEPPSEVSANPWRDELEITLTPGEGAEVKVQLAAGEVARFSWEGVEGPLNYDTHGNGNGQSISYEKGRGVRSDEGELTAAFEGYHGWFFRNRTEGDVTLILRLGGDYSEVKRFL